MTHCTYNEEICEKNILIDAAFNFSRNGYVKKDGRRMIVLNFYINGKYMELKTGMSTYVKNTNDLNIEEKITLEHMLFNMKLAIYKAMQEGKAFKDLKTLKYALQHKTIKNANFIEFGYEWINASNKAEGTKSNYKSILKMLEGFDKNLKVSDLNYDKGLEIIKYFEEIGSKKNSIPGKISSLKTILSAAEKEIGLQESTFHKIEIKGEKNLEKRPFIEKNQILKIERQIFNHKRDEKIRDIFLLSVYSGMRFSDIKTLKNNNLKEGWLEKKTQKTGVNVAVPIGELFNGKALKLIEKYGEIEKLVKGIGENGAFNAKLKEIFKLCGLEKEANEKRWTFHTARHTFATLLLEEGLNPITIQKMLGHSKIGTTMNVYAEVTKNVIKNDLKNLKKKK